MELSRRRKLIYSLVGALGIPLALLAALELGGHLWMHFRYGVPGKSYGIYIADAELGATHRPNSYNHNSVINNRGFRNADDVPPVKPPGATRIYCSGGSTTFCYNLPTEQAWPSQLRDQLRRLPGHEKDEVWNGGQICFPVADELILARRVIPELKPDVVVVFTGINELLAAEIIAGADGESLDRLLAENRFGVAPRGLDQARFLKRHSVLVRLLDYVVKRGLEKRLTADYRAPGAKPKPIHPWVDANFQHTFREYLAFLRAQGCKIVVVRAGDNGVESWHLDEVRRFRDEAVAIARSEGAHVFDFAAAIEGRADRRSLFIESGVHLTETGSRLFAERLRQFLTDEVLAK
jgi:lysophospholipase L1-like esterase